MTSTGRLSAAALQTLLASQRQQLLNDAREGKNVEPQLDELAYTIARQYRREDVAVADTSSSFDQMYEVGLQPGVEARDAHAAGLRELAAQRKVSHQFDSLRLAIVIIEDGPGDGSRRGQSALYELAKNPDVLGFTKGSGFLRVVIKPDAKADLNAWFDRNAADLRAGYRVEALEIEPPLT